MFFISIYILLTIVLFIIIAKIRVIVPINEVHIVRTNNSSSIFGKGQKAGNIYLKWPTIKIKVLPINIFLLKLKGYKGYDINKISFEIDISAFFNIKNPVLTDNIFLNIDEVKTKLNKILKLHVRKHLATKDIIKIINSRKEIKDELYEKIYEEIKSLGINLYNIDIMDIRDDSGYHTIDIVMKKRRSILEDKYKKEILENEKKYQLKKKNYKYTKIIDRLPFKGNIKKKEINIKIDKNKIKPKNIFDQNNFFNEKEDSFL